MDQREQPPVEAWKALLRKTEDMALAAAEALRRGHDPEDIADAIADAINEGIWTI